jgi:hypothetical protein
MIGFISRASVDLYKLAKDSGLTTGTLNSIGSTDESGHKSDKCGLYLLCTTSAIMVMAIDVRPLGVLMFIVTVLRSEKRRAA